MRRLLFICIVLAQVSTINSQRAIRFADSLTLDLKRSWIETSGVEYTNVGDDCSYGMEITFYKEGSKAIMHHCHEGEWKKFDLRYEVTSEFEEHFIRFYRQETHLFFFKREVEVIDYQMEAQMVADSQNEFRTELYMFNLNNKTTRTLRSKG